MLMQLLTGPSPRYDDSPVVADARSAVARPGLAMAATADPAGARDMLRRLFLDQALVTDDALAARCRATQDGAAAFAPIFPPPRQRWVDDLTLSVPTLAQVRAPVLLVHGAQDRVTPMIDCPEEFWRVLSNFLGDSPPAVTCGTRCEHHRAPGGASKDGDIEGR